MHPVVPYLRRSQSAPTCKRLTLNILAALRRGLNLSGARGWCLACNVTPDMAAPQTVERRKPCEGLGLLRDALRRRGGYVCILCLALDTGLPAPDVNRCFQHRQLTGFLFRTTTCEVCRVTQAWCAAVDQRSLTRG